MYFCIHSCCCMKSVQVFKDICPICYYALYIPSINLSWIKSSSVVCSSCSCFYPLFVNGVHILWLFLQFLVSLTGTSIFLPRPTFSWTSYFFLWLDLFFKKSVFKVCGIRHGGDFRYRLVSSCSQKEICNLIFSSLFLVVFQLFSFWARSKIS